MHHGVGACRNPLDDDQAPSVAGGLALTTLCRFGVRNRPHRPFRTKAGSAERKEQICEGATADGVVRQGLASGNRLDACS